MSYKRKDIPDRWLEYKSIGNKIAGTPFVAFKVPLHKTFCENLPEFERHTTREVIEALPELGMVIDLTNTPNRTRYYQPEDWKSNGIDYKWIKCEGHVTPSQEVLVHFCRTVKKFMNKNPTKLIGIHCTHGLNRTGYFVCSFMVLVLKIPPHDALQSFSEARGYDIERENYISSIISHERNGSLKRMVIETDTPRVIDPFAFRHQPPPYFNPRYVNRSSQNYEQRESRFRERPQHSQNRYHPFLHPTQQRGGARQSDFGHYQSNKRYNRSWRRQDDNQNYNN